MKTFEEKIRIAETDNKYTREKFTPEDIDTYCRLVLSAAEKVGVSSEIIEEINNKLIIIYKKQNKRQIAGIWNYRNTGGEKAREKYCRLELTAGFIDTYLTSETVREITNTLIHEIGHAIAYDQSHSRYWKNISNEIAEELRKEDLYFGGEISRLTDGGTGFLVTTAAKKIIVTENCYGDFDIRPVYAEYKNVGLQKYGIKPVLVKSEDEVIDDISDDINVIWRTDTDIFDNKSYNEAVELIIEYRKAVYEIEE